MIEFVQVCAGLLLLYVLGLLCYDAGERSRIAMLAHSKLWERVEEARGALDIVKAINVLRGDEGDAVEIVSDNADSDGPNCVITVGWDFDQCESFYGETIMECLSKALAARVKRKLWQT